MNTGTTRIVIIAALIVVGFIVLVNGFSDSGGQAAVPGSTVTPTIGPSPSHTRSRTPSPTLSPQVAKKISFFVLNGTNTVGLAGVEQRRLEKEGLLPALNTAGAAAGDAPQKPQAKTIVYFRGGDQVAQNKADAQWVATTYYSGAAVRQLSDSLGSTSVVPAAANVIVLLGVDTVSP